MRLKSEGSAIKDRTEKMEPSEIFQCTSLDKSEIATGVYIQYMTLIIMKYNHKISRNREKCVPFCPAQKRTEKRQAVCIMNCTFVKSSQDNWTEKIN